MNILPELLRKKRMEKGFQAKDMANALELDASIYSRIENGKTKITLDMAEKLANILQVPISDLIDNFQGKYEIKNGDHSPFAIENSTLNCDNKKLTDSIFILMDQLTKLITQQILIMQNQNDLFKDFVKVKKDG